MTAPTNCIFPRALTFFNTSCDAEGVGGGLGERVGEALGPLRAVVSNRDLRRLELAWALTNVCGWAYAVAVGAYAYQRSGPTGVGVVGFARLIAPALLLPFLSLLGDRHRRTRVLVLSALSGAVFLAAAAVAVFAGASAIVVYVLAVGVMVGASVFRPTQAALLPSLARESGSPESPFQGGLGRAMPLAA
jgi:MFS family permease